VKVYKKDHYTVEVYDKDLIPGYDTKILWKGNFVGYSVWGDELEKTIQEKGLELVR